MVIIVKCELKRKSICTIIGAEVKNFTKNTILRDDDDDALTFTLYFI